MTTTQHPVARGRRLALRRWVPYLLLAVAYVLSAAASWYVASTKQYVASTQEARVRAKFLTDAAQTRYQIRTRLDTYFDVVWAGAALLSARSEINFAEFQAFVAGLALHERYPGMQGIGFAPRVRRQELLSFVRLVRLDGMSGMRVWPPGRRPEYYPVVLIEPRDRKNSEAIGFDLATDAALLAVIERARDSGEPTASGKLTHHRPITDGLQPAFVLVVPIYPLKAPLRTVDERRRALVGFVFSRFNPAELLNGIAGTTSALAVDVYDGPVASDAALLRAGSAAGGDQYESAEPIRVAGRDWLIVVRSGASRAGVAASFDRGTLAGGFLLSLMLFLITAAQVRAWETAARHEAELRDLAQHDHLTQLPNRALMGEHLTKAIALARRRGSHVAVLFMDMDGFKHINDSLGHAVGDLLLQSVAGRLLACVRSSDTVSRHGGDEFVVMLVDIEHADHAAARAQKIIGTVTAPHDVAGHHVQATVSVGVSIFPGDGEDAETLIRAADTAMYQAKESGRNHYQFFMPDMNARAVERQWIEAGLRRALAHREFVLHYQPKICLATGMLAGAEALIRWSSPNRGLIAPTAFVPTAEDCGLIVPIGQWVLREACQQARSWIDAGRPVPVSVNISSIEFRDRAFVGNLQSVLDETGLPPDYLELELTESILMQHAASSVSVLHAVKDLGVKIALDDFGTGYSSLSYLRQFPIDVLKVDQSFVHEITGATHGGAIVSAIIGLGRSLRHRVIAEGVETQQQLAFLQAQQCGDAQGFYFSRPVEADEFKRVFLSESRAVGLEKNAHQGRG